MKHGFDPGLAWHMGKIMECGALCAGDGRNPIIGTLRSAAADSSSDPVPDNTHRLLGMGRHARLGLGQRLQQSFLQLAVV